MVGCIILNPIIIPVYLLNVFVTLSGSSNIGDLKFEDDDNFGVKSQNSPANSDADYSELFHTEQSNVLSEPPDTDSATHWEQSRIPSNVEEMEADYSQRFHTEKSSVPSKQPNTARPSKKPKIPSTVEEMEAVFITMYECYREWKKWDLMDNEDHRVLLNICAALWDNSPNLTCEAQLKPFHKNPGDSYRVVVTEKMYGQTIEKKIRTDFLKCKCWPSELQAYIGRRSVLPICLAKYDDSHVFVLKGPKRSREMKICEIKHINHSS